MSLWFKIFAKVGPMYGPLLSSVSIAIEDYRYNPFRLFQRSMVGPTSLIQACCVLRRMTSDMTQDYSPLLMESRGEAESVQFSRLST